MESRETEAVPNVWLSIDNSVPRDEFPRIRVRVGDQYGNGHVASLGPEQVTELADALVAWPDLPYRYPVSETEDGGTR